MSTVTVQLPESLKNKIEALAAQEGYSAGQFLASAAGEKLAVVLTTDYLRREAEAGRREDFDRYLASVPDAPPVPWDPHSRLITRASRLKPSRSHSRKSTQFAANHNRGASGEGPGASLRAPISWLLTPDAQLLAPQLSQKKLMKLAARCVRLIRLYTCEKA